MASIFQHSPKIRSGKFSCVLLTVILFFTSLLWREGVAYGQTYPVHISTQLVPPYSGYLPDYADPAAEKLKVILQFNDFSVPQYNLKLKFEIKGNGFTISTKTFYNPPPITLMPGQPLLLSNSDLAHYLNSNNLDFVGINQSQYEQRMALPEGYYSICVTAYDYFNSTKIQVSNESCAQAWFTLSDPPFINLPVCGSVLTPLIPQNILFQWTPMNLGSPNAAFSTEYEFALWECRPDSNTNPNQVVLSTAPIFSIVTQQTFLNYSIIEPNLNLYMKYIWRVRAKDNTGRDLFKNNGYSQICTFKYGSVSNVLGDALNITLNAQAISHRTGQCDWTKQTAFVSYLLQVRKQGANFWFDYPNYTGIERVSNLEPATTYECRVRGEGNGITGNWSNVALFTTAGPPNYSCNDQDIQNNGVPPEPLPLNKAIAGLVIQSGQFEIFTTKIEQSGAPGWYKGRGYAMIFGLKKLPVKWDNIYIDIDSRQQQGVIEALTNGIEKWLSQWDLSEAEQNANYVNGAIDSVFINGNQVCYTLQGDGNPICIPTASNQNTQVIRDGEGNQYVINLIPPPAKITGPTNYLNYSDDSLKADANHIVFFQAAAAQNFGFDKKQYAAFIKDYEVIKLNNGNNYFISNKGIGEGSTDEVLAQLQINNLNPNLLNFKTKDQSILSTVTTSVVNMIKISGIPANAECVYAWYDNKKIGKLNVVRLKETLKKLVLVPVNGSPVGQDLSASINSIFKQANATWSVSVAANFAFNLGNDGLEAADANIFSKYSAEMRSLRDAYKAFDSLYDKTAYYLFVVPNFTNPDLKGYMVRGKALGFVTSNVSAKEIAHELAHGAFGLEHTFPEIDKGTSNNLMDYTNGTQLVKKQWDAIQYLNLKPSWFDDEEDAALVTLFQRNNSTLVVYNWINKLKIAYKNNTKVTIPKDNYLIGEAANCVLGGLQFPFINVYVKNVVIDESVPVKDRLSIGTASVEMYHTTLLQPCLLVDNGKVIIHAPAGLLPALKTYIETNTFKNLILFVNGYRPIVNRNGDPLVNSLLEYPDSNNEIEAGDSRGYWKGIDAQFMNRIGTRNAVYVDGHHGVSTSNHGSVVMYTGANVASALIQAQCEHSLGGVACLITSYLHTKPNVDGFLIRQRSGATAAADLISKINQGIHIFNKETDTLDIVSHSMGYAYAVGMIKTLKSAGIKFGRFYIIAPENACSGGEDWGIFKEVWQYGSNLGQQNADPPFQQDGVAPQIAVPDIEKNYAKTKTGRAFIPQSVTTKSFLGSHSISNYGWIFSERTEGKIGYVRAR